MTVAVALWAVGVFPILFAGDFIFRVLGVIAFIAAIPVAIAGGRGLRARR